MRRLLALLAVLTLIAAACGDDGGDGNDASPADDGAAADDGTEAEPEPEPEPDPDPDADPEPEPEPEPEPSARDFSAISPIVESFLAENDLNGAGLIVVERDEGIIHEDYWGEFSEDRVSLIMSTSKMVSAGVLMHLDDEGALDVDAPIADLAPWAADHPDITAAQLVSNSSGLVGLAGALDGGADFLCQYNFATTLQACAETLLTTTIDDEDTVPPDTEFRYGGGQWQVAGAVAELASGKSWNELVDEIYVEPCGLENFGYTSPWVPLGASFEYPDWDGDLSLLPPTDNPNMEGGVYTTARDYAELLLMHLRDGMCGDTQVLSPDALAQMHENRTGRVYDSPVGYGMGWWTDAAAGRITDPGAYGAVSWLQLDDGFGAYMVIEDSSVVGNQLAGLLYGPVEEAVLG
ncbi:MAG: serine hydrolase [Acidimicrobiales bacterium]|nr:serine hydrolase [Acidimicrobiales bacterium]